MELFFLNIASFARYNSADKLLSDLDGRGDDTVGGTMVDFQVKMSHEAISS